MALVNEDHGIVLVCQGTDLWQGGHVTIHAEHSVCHYEPHPGILSLLQLSLQVLRGKYSIRKRRNEYWVINPIKVR